MAVDFYGAWVKLNRAQMHLHVLNREIRKRLEDEEQRVSRHIEDQGAKHVYRFDGTTDVPTHWSAAVGDVLHNARSALDHVAWQLVLAAGGTPNRYFNYFPVHLQSPRDQVGLCVPLYLANKVSAEVIAFVESIQPYHGLNDPIRSDLWMLHDLDRVDKHRGLLLTYVAFDSATTGTFPGYQLTYVGRSLLVTGEPVGHFTVDPPDPNLDLNPQFSFDVFTQEMRPRSVPEALHDLLRTATWVVEECERLDPNVVQRRP